MYFAIERYERLKDARPAIYEVPPSLFEPVLLESGKPSGEYRSTRSIPLKECVVTPLPGVDTAMRAGCQFFFLADGVSKAQWFDLTRAEFTRSDMTLTEQQRADKLLGFYRRQVEAGILIHENAERGINPVDLATGKIRRTHLPNGELLPGLRTQVQDLGMKGIVEPAQALTGMSGLPVTAGRGARQRTTSR